MVARYGGEEIIAILVGGDRSEAAAAAARALKAVATWASRTPAPRPGRT